MEVGGTQSPNLGRIMLADAVPTPRSYCYNKGEGNYLSVLVLTHVATYNACKNIVCNLCVICEPLTCVCYLVAQV